MYRKLTVQKRFFRQFEKKIKKKSILKKWAVMILKKNALQKQEPMVIFLKHKKMFLIGLAKSKGER